MAVREHGRIFFEQSQCRFQPGLHGRRCPAEKSLKNGKKNIGAQQAD